LLVSFFELAGGCEYGRQFRKLFLCNARELQCLRLPGYFVDVQETGKPAPVTPMPPEDGEVTEGERATGWSKKGAASANGAQCEIWEDRSGYQLCVWTGGRKWGYPTDGPIALKDGLSNGGSIVLWAHGGKDPNWRLETREFTVGTPIDERAFVPPVQ